MDLEDLRKLFYNPDYIKKNVLIRNVFLHKLSFEESTGKFNDKYKLVINRQPDLGYYFFVIFNSHNYTCPKHVRVEIQESDYEDKPGKYPKGTSFLNTEKVFWERTDKLIGYHINPDDEFKYMGRIYQVKLNEIKDLCKKIQYTSSDDIVKDTVLAGAGQIDNFIKRFNI